MIPLLACLLTVMRSLVGDFDFVEMYDVAPIVGPILFISFVFLAV